MIDPSSILHAADDAQAASDAADAYLASAAGAERTHLVIALPEEYEHVELLDRNGVARVVQILG
jgi:hypothetical protein